MYAQQYAQRQKTNEKCRGKLPPPCTKSPPFWLPFNRHLNTVYTPIKRSQALHTIRKLHKPQEAPKTPLNSPTTSFFRLLSPLHVPVLPIFRPSRAISPPFPSNCPPQQHKRTETKKASQSSHNATFARIQFNLIQPHVVQSSP